MKAKKKKKAYKSIRFLWGIRIQTSQSDKAKLSFLNSLYLQTTREAPKLLWTLLIKMFSLKKNKINISMSLIPGF